MRWDTEAKVELFGGGDAPTSLPFAHVDRGQHLAARAELRIEPRLYFEDT